MLRTALWSSVLLASTSFAGTKVPKPEMLVKVAPVHTGAVNHIWPSGLRTALGHDDTRDVVVTTVIIGGGFTDDPVGRTGTGRVFEAAFWQAELEGGERVVDAFVSRLGCTVDGMVEHDSTVMQSVCPARFADAAMDVWAQLFRDPLQGIDEEGAKRIASRQASDQSVRAKLAQRPTYDVMPYMIMQMLPADHGYFAEPDPRLTRVRLQDLKTWVGEHIVPQNVSISILGNFPVKHGGYGPSLISTHFPPEVLAEGLRDDHIVRTAKEWIKDPDPNDPHHWWGWAVDPNNLEEALPWDKQPPPRTDDYKEDPPAPPGRPFARMPGPVDESLALVSWSLPPSWQAIDGMSAAVAIMLQETLVLNLVGNEPSLGGAPSCEYIEGLRMGSVVCKVALKEGQEAAGERVSQRMIDQLSDLVDPTKVTEHQVLLNRAKLRVMVNMLTSHSRFSGLIGSRASWTARGLHYANNGMIGLERISQVGVLELAPVMDFIKLWLTRDRACTFQVDPHGIEEATVRALQSGSLNTDDRERRGTYWNRFATGDLAPPVSADRVNRETVASSWAAADAIEVKTLANGLTVAVVSHGDLPHAVLRIVSKGGFLNDPSEHFDGVFGRKSILMDLEPAGAVGGSWHGIMTDNVFQVGVSASYPNLDGGLWMLRAALDSASVNFKLKAGFLKNSREDLIEEWYEPDWHARSLAFDHALAGHRAGRQPGWEDFEHWASLSSGDIKDIHRSKWRPEEMLLVIVRSSRATEDAFGLAEQYFSTFEQDEPSDDRYVVKGAPKATMAKKRAFAIYPTEGKFADVRVVCPMPGNEGLVHTTAELMKRALDEPWVSSHITPYVYSDDLGALDMRARVPSDTLGSALTGWLGLIDKAEVRDDKLRQAAWFTSMRISGENWGPMLVAGRIADQWGRGKPVTKGFDLSQDIASITSADVSGALKQCGAGAYVALLGDEAAIRKQLDGVGIKYDVVDWSKRGEDMHKAADPKGYARSKK